MTKEQTCRGKGCGAAIIWVRLNGRWHPANPRKLSIIVDESGGKLVAGYESHYATCPDAATFRNRGG